MGPDTQLEPRLSGSRGIESLSDTEIRRATPEPVHVCMWCCPSHAVVARTLSVSGEPPPSSQTDVGYRLNGVEEYIFLSLDGRMVLPPLQFPGL